MESDSSFNRSWTSWGWPLAGTPGGAHQENTLSSLQYCSCHHLCQQLWQWYVARLQQRTGSNWASRATGKLWTMKRKIRTADSSSWGSGLGPRSWAKAETCCTGAISYRRVLPIQDDFRNVLHRMQQMIVSPLIPINCHCPIFIHAKKIDQVSTDSHWVTNSSSPSLWLPRPTPKRALQSSYWKTSKETQDKARKPSVHQTMLR